MLTPLGRDVRVRGIHAQNDEAESGGAGQRCALNITAQGLSRANVHRGDWVSAPETHAPTRRFDAHIRVLRSEQRSLKHWTPVHMHLAAADVTGRVAILEGREIAPGESGLVQIVLDEPIGALWGDRLILRDQSAQRTVAGGTVIDPFSPARGRARPERIETVKALELKDAGKSLTTLLDNACGRGFGSHSPDRETSRPMRPRTSGVTRRCSASGAQKRPSVYRNRVGKRSLKMRSLHSANGTSRIPAIPDRQRTSCDGACRCAFLRISSQRFCWA